MAAKDPEAHGKWLARRLVHAARSWARKIARLGDKDRVGIYDLVFREVLSFAVRLVQLRLDDDPSPADPAARAAFVEQLRTECGRKTGSAPPASNPAPLQLECQPCVAEARSSRSESSERDPDPPLGSAITKELFAQFCESTGLATSALAAGGINLASLMFYLAIYSLVIADRTVTLEQKQLLLRTVQECKDHFLALEILPPSESGPAALLDPGVAPKSLASSAAHG